MWEVVIFLFSEMNLRLACTMKPHDILKVTNYVETHALRHGIQHLKF